MTYNKNSLVSLFKNMNQKKSEENKKYLNLKPNLLLAKFLSRVPKGRALDLGIGQGKNALYLAQNGFEVEAIDINEQNLKKIAEASKNSGFSIKTKLINIKNFDFRPDNYTLILAISSLIFFKKSEFKKIINKIKKGLTKGGVVLISSFTTLDPSFQGFLKKHEMIEENTFYNEKTKTYWNFLESNELKSYFRDGFKILFYKEIIVRDNVHPETTHPHCHGLAQIVAKKENVFPK